MTDELIAYLAAALAAVAAYVLIPLARVRLDGTVRRRLWKRSLSR